MPGYADKQKRYRNELPSQAVRIGLAETIVTVKRILFEGAKRRPQRALPYQTPDLAAFLGAPGRSRFVWLGHSSILLNLEGLIVLIDPVFSLAASPVPWFVQRFQAPVLDAAALPSVDVILISHDHYDHLDQGVARFYASKHAEFIVPSGVARHLRRWGVPAGRITELGWHQGTTRQGVSFTAAPARHSSGRGLFDHNATLWASWVIECGDASVFFSGDSSYGPHFREIRERYGPFDLAFIENGQYDSRWPEVHMLPEQSARAVEDIGAVMTVPIHWGMFDMALHHWTEPVEQLTGLAAANGSRLLVPRIGELVFVGTQTDWTPWWRGV